MSILNHFGKVKTTFVPYKNKHSYGVNTSRSEFIHSYGSTSIAIQAQFHLYTNGKSTLNWLKGYGIGTHDALGPGTQTAINYIAKFFDEQHAQLHTAKYTSIQDFAKVVDGIVTDITSSLWETVKIIPVLTLTQLLCLKVDDLDSRVDHLEKMLAQVIDDNKLLQRKVDALEQQKRLRESRDSKFKIGRVLIQELD